MVAKVDKVKKDRAAKLKKLEGLFDKLQTELNVAHDMFEANSDRQHAIVNAVEYFHGMRAWADKALS